MESAILNQPIVIDNGSSWIRSGIAGESAPSISFPAFVGRPKHDRVMIGSLEGNKFVGQHAQEHRGLLSLSYPTSHGAVNNWEDLESVWQYLYANHALHSEEHPVLVTEPPITAQKQREQAAQILFETFNVPALYFAVPAVLSLYAAGKTTGLALDVGDGVAHCVPVYQGFAINTAIMRSDLGGANVTDFLQLLLRKQGISLMTSAEREIVKQIKELHAFVVPELAQRRSGRQIDEDGAEIVFKLPDGQKIKLNNRELGRAPELQFRPHIFGSEDKAVHQLVSDAIARSDMDLRAPLYQSIVLSGGSTLTRGFGDRLLNELKEAAPGATKIRIFAPSNRIQTAWIGGSILAGLSTFKKMWLTAEEWEEQPNRVNLQ